MTTNKNLQQPANGSDVGYWDQPLNNNFTLIDAALGAVQQFNVGSVGPVTINVSGGTFVGAYPANTPSYVPLVMYVFGAPTGNITLQLPAGVGGQWIIWNAISNSYTLTVKMSGGTASVVIPNSSTRSVYCDQATGVYFSDSQTTVAGSSGQVIYNSGGSLTGSSSLTFDGTTMTAPALVASTNVAASGNLTAGGAISSTTTVTAGTGFVFPDSTTQITAYGGAVPGAFSGLKISAASSTVAVTYNYVSLLSTTNFKTVSSGSLSISTAASGANGLDTGTIAANTWYSVYVIYNPTTLTVAGLISLSGTSPTLPSGYTYKARVGWVRYGASALVASTQYGSSVRYTALSTGFPVLYNTAATLWTAQSVSALVPTTASAINVQLANATTGGQMSISANSSPANYQLGAAWVFPSSNYNDPAGNQATIFLETTNVYLYSSFGTTGVYGIFYCLGWIDNL